MLSPILVRPVREQLEHDRVIRLLQAKYKKKFEVGINPGAEQAVPVGAGDSPIFPDVVLQSPERSRKLMGVVEVETSESINHLEAMSQWAALARLRVPFYLYVPAGSIDTTRRLCTDHHIPVTEVWTFHSLGDQMRFTLMIKAPQAPPPRPVARSAASPTRRVAKASTAHKSGAARNASKSAARKPPLPPRTNRAAAAKSASRGRVVSTSKARKPAAGAARLRKRK